MQKYKIALYGDCTGKDLNQCDHVANRQRVALHCHLNQAHS